VPVEEWPPLLDDVYVLRNYESIASACRNAVANGRNRVVVLVKDVEELTRIEEPPLECIMLIKPEDQREYING